MILYIFFTYLSLNCFFSYLNLRNIYYKIFLVYFKRFKSDETLLVITSELKTNENVQLFQVIT